MACIIFLDGKWWISKKCVFAFSCFNDRLGNFRRSTELSASGVTSEKLALIFKFIYKPWIIGFHSFLSLTNDQGPLYKLYVSVLSLHSEYMDPF